MQATVWLQQIHELIRNEPMRVVVEEFPEVMPVLATYGFDLCCGGSHSIEEASRLHGLEPEAVLTATVDAIVRTHG